MAYNISNPLVWTGSAEDDGGDTGQLAYFNVKRARKAILQGSPLQGDETVED